MSLQSRSDTYRQQEVANLCAEQWGVRFLPTPLHETFDYTITRRTGEFIGLAGVKCRAVPEGAYATFFASLRKWASMRLHA